MPVFHVTSPDGRTIEVTAPDGASEQDAIQYAQSRPDLLNPAAPPESTFHKVASAYGNAVAGPVEAAAQIGTGAVAAPVAGIAGLGAAAAHAMGANVDPADVVSGVQRNLTYPFPGITGHSEPLTQGGKDTAGAVNAVAGLIPKGADIAGQKTAELTGSPAAGAAVNTGLQALGMWATGKVPGVIGSAPVTRVGNLVSDYLPGGPERAANRVINNYATDTTGGRSAAQANVQAHVDAEKDLAQAGQSGALATKYGISPTGTQVSESSGLAQLDRTMRNQGDGVPAPLNAADKNNRGAVINILHKISGTPEARLRAIDDRETATKDIYNDALNNPDHFVQPPSWMDRSFDAEAAAKKGLTQDGAPSVNDPNQPPTGLNPVGVRLQDLLQRPAMETAMKNAHMQAGNLGIKINDRNLMQQLHYAKMDLDGQIGAASRTGDGTTMGGLLDTKRTLLGVMDDLSPAYKAARETYASSSKPINRMDVGRALKEKYLSALQESSGTGSRPSMLLEALRKNDGDTIARSATGFNGASLDTTLHPEDLAALDAARTQLGREAFGQNAGRGVGSPTAQNRASQAAIDNIGDARSAVGRLGELGAALHNPLVSLAAGMRGASVREAAQLKIAQTLASPEDLAAALKKQYAGSIPDQVTMPAAVGANADSQDHAAGGAIKPTFWDLTQHINAR